MARDIICDVDHVEIARWLVGDLRSGDQVGLCDEHLIAWGLAQIDTMLDEGQRLVAISKLAAKLPEPPAAEDEPELPPGLARAIQAEIEHGAEEPPPARPKRGHRRMDAEGKRLLFDSTQEAEAWVAEGKEQRDQEPASEEVAGQPPAADDG